MDQQQDDFVYAFDMMYTTNHIQILKVVLPYFEPALQHQLAVYIKYLELQYTLKTPIKEKQNLKASGNDCGCPSPKVPKDKKTLITSLVKSIKPYLTEQELKQVSQIENAFQAMNNMQEMQKMMELLSQSGLLQTDSLDENQIKNMEAMLHEFF